jgi:hypothetical protein
MYPATVLGMALLELVYLDSWVGMALFYLVYPASVGGKDPVTTVVSW